MCFLQLRCQESRARLDALAGAVESEGWAVAVPFIGQGNDSNSSLKSALWSNTMPLPQLFAVVSSTASPIMLKLLIAVLIELEWTNHAQNALTALRKEYLGWQAVIVNRVMWWTLEGLYVDINTATSEFPWKTALQLTSESTMPTISSLPCGVLVTIQLTSSVSILDRLSQWTQVSGSARGKFAKWSPLSEMADASVSLLLATAWIWNEHLKSDRQDLKPFFLKQCRKWAMCIPLFWDRIVLRILHDVRGTMQSGIEQIPTQYRMTNKPMPLHHNSYIVSVCDNARKSWESVRENWLICVKDPLLKHFLSMDIPSELTDSLLADLLSTVPRALWSRLLEMFCGYAAKMLKTVREIDNRLSKRTGVSTRSGPATATDSDKILVQLWRDLHWVIKSAHESSDQAADTTLTNDLREQAQWAAQMLYPPLETLLSEFKDIERYVNTSS